MSCVQCHAHPYDPIKHDEFYKLFAFFNNTQDSDQPVDESPVYMSYDETEESKIKKFLTGLKHMVTVKFIRDTKTFFINTNLNIKQTWLEILQMQH